jgi:hypothetical protein
MYALGSALARNNSGIGSDMGRPVSSSAFSSRMAVGRRASSPRGSDVLLRRYPAGADFLAASAVAPDRAHEAAMRGTGNWRTGLGAAGTGLPNRHRTAAKSVPAKSQIKRRQRIGTRPMCAQPSANYETKVAAKILLTRTTPWAPAVGLSALGLSELVMVQGSIDRICIVRQCRRTPRSPNLRQLPVAEDPTMGRRGWKRPGGFR